MVQPFPSWRELAVFPRQHQRNTPQVPAFQQSGIYSYTLSVSAQAGGFNINVFSYRMLSRYVSGSYSRSRGSA
jgi:hypothetical protein